MKKRIVFAIGTAMLLSLAACSTNAASTETGKEPEPAAQSEQATENEAQGELVLGAPDEQEQAFGKERKSVPESGAQQDGQTKRGKHGDGQLPVDGIQPDRQQGRKGRGDGQLPADGTQPDGITGATPKAGSDRSGQRKQKDGSDGNGSLTIVEPTEPPESATGPEADTEATN